MILVHTRRTGSQADRGDTLIEILMTVVIMGITVTALVGGLTLLISGTNTHRRLADVEVLSRSYGEMIVDQAMHPKSTDLAAATTSGASTITVSSSAGFTGLSTPFTASVDGEVVSISNVNGGTNVWTVQGGINDVHAAGGAVTQYKSCPATSDLFVSGFTPPADSRVIAPVASDITNVEYFDRAGASISAGSCANYWDATALPCSAFETNDHLTDCDPPVIKVTFRLQSTDASTANGATAKSSVIIRRGTT